MLATLTSPAWAQDTSPWSIDLTEEPEPDSKAWEDPARLALTIDPDGPDRFSAHLNLEVGRSLTPRATNDYLPRSRSAGGYLRWDRESSGDDRQNNLEAGLSFRIGHDVASVLDLGNLGPDRTPDELNRLQRQRGRRWDFSHRFSTAFSRTAHYPDLGSPTCTATPTVAQCRTQFRESLRSSAAVTAFNANLERRCLAGLACSIQPKLQIDHDLILNNPINPDTGLEVRGGYLSVLGGLAATVTPSFINPGWELQASYRVRQQLAASDTRRPLIERTAERLEVSGTYYFLRPSATTGSDWRAGVSLTYSNGGDPLTGAPDVERIVLAFRLGRY
jgi:hypothetical protein